jgi:hypothetical protein
MAAVAFWRTGLVLKQISRKLQALLIPIQTTQGDQE